MLLIHGMPTNGRLWDDVVHELAPHFQCFVIDLPGMGDTPFIPKDRRTCLKSQLRLNRCAYAIAFSVGTSWNATRGVQRLRSVRSCTQGELIAWR